MSRYIFSTFYSNLRHFFSSRYTLELKLAIYHRAASLSSQASSVDDAVVAQELLTMFCLNTESTTDEKESPCLSSLHAHKQYVIQQSWAIIVFCC